MVSRCLTTEASRDWKPEADAAGGEAASASGKLGAKAPGPGSWRRDALGADNRPTGSHPVGGQDKGRAGFLWGKVFMSTPSELGAVTWVPSVAWAPARLVGAVLDLVFPPRCAACQRVGAVLCDDCLSRVRPVPLPICTRCGRPNQVAAPCVDCRSDLHAVGAIRAVGTYSQPLSTAIHQFKYRGRRELGAPLGAMMAGYWLDRRVTVDLAIPVPLHERRRQERGFNQARLLAEEFSLRTGLPLLASGVLRRHQDTGQQALLDAAERRTNVAGAFSWHGPQLGGLKVLLIDDVITSGSTVEACGRVLRAAGAGKVWALTVARALSATDGT